MPDDSKSGIGTFTWQMPEKVFLGVEFEHYKEFMTAVKPQRRC